MGTGDSANTILQALGRIEGKVDEISSAAKEHREDDKRRFSEVYGKLDEHSVDINQAKGAKGALLWVAAGIATAAGAVAAVAAKALGLH